MYRVQEVSWFFHSAAPSFFLPKTRPWRVRTAPHVQSHIPPPTRAVSSSCLGKKHFVTLSYQVRVGRFANLLSRRRTPCFPGGFLLPASRNVYVTSSQTFPEEIRARNGSVMRDLLMRREFCILRCVSLFPVRARVRSLNTCSPPTSCAYECEERKPCRSQVRCIGSRRLRRYDEHCYVSSSFFCLFLVDFLIELGIFVVPRALLDSNVL